MKILFILLFTCITKLSFAQDISFARKMVDTLTSSYFWGRGYTNDGVGKSARFLSREFQSYGLKPLNDSSFLQDFSFPVNTFPGKMEVWIDGVKLCPGRDYIISPESKGVKTKSTLVKKDSVHFADRTNQIRVSLADKLTWSVSQETTNYTSILLNKNAVKSDPEKIKLHIENKLVDNFKSYNVCGIVKGTINPDSMIVITAHYDHLGGMGNNTYFPGANDNASGVALMLRLAKFYAGNPQKYSLVFIAFSGEEAGLLGSKFFTEHPLVDLKKIRFLVNTDLAGTGEEGITVVNATQYKREFALLHKINEEFRYLAKINSRGKAANSDHYWFSEKGVPSFFIYTMGGIRAYHDIYDRAETLPLTEHDDLFQLITRFNQSLMQ
jgi:aminopeptidase YwaD